MQTKQKHLGVEPDVFEILLDHKNTDGGFFSTSLADTPLENEDKPTSNTYTIIDYLNSNTTSRDTYLDEDNKYAFELVHRYPRRPLVGYGTQTVQNVYNNGYTEVSHENSVSWNGITNMPMGDGNYYRNFIAIHPNTGIDTYVEWNMASNYNRFTAVIGNRGIACTTGCQLAFIIYVDGVQKYSSGSMSVGEYQYVDIE